MVKQANAERRRWLRAKRVLSVQHRLAKPQNDASNNPWHLSTTYDMSLGGLAFYSDVEYRIGDVLEVHVVMSGLLDIFKGNGKIVRIERKKTGVYFLIALKFLENSKTRRAKTYKSRAKIQLRSLKRI
ncbi:MAG: PilZ domain-containing protein [Candidatus Omnitrophica bacterium]|nr:PilZ domain-containing protein [Candidatus Omnitrophota bacterium]